MKRFINPARFKKNNSITKATTNAVTKMIVKQIEETLDGFSFRDILNNLSVEGREALVDYFLDKVRTLYEQGSYKDACELSLYLLNSQLKNETRLNNGHNAGHHLPENLEKTIDEALARNDVQVAQSVFELARPSLEKAGDYPVAVRLAEKVGCEHIIAAYHRIQNIFNVIDNYNAGKL